MAIEKNSFKVTRFDPEYHSQPSGDTVMSSDDEEFQRRNSISVVESDADDDDDDDDDDEFDDCDSGAGSDDFDLLELGETGEEFCQVGDQTCSIPYELYDLQGLDDVLSMEVWNEVLTEEERFGLAKYLPDMDQENFVRTLKEIFGGDNLHFGNPVSVLFDMLKGGLCEPRVALYRQGLNFFQRKKHYHNLRKHHNATVNNICQIRDAWLNCKGYSIEEKLRVLNIMKSQKSLMNENMEEFECESSDREQSGDSLWGKKVKDRKQAQKPGLYSGYGIGASSDISSRGHETMMETAKHGKKKLKGNLKFAGSKPTSKKEVVNFFPSIHPGVEVMPGRYDLEMPLSRFNVPVGHDSSDAVGMNEKIIASDDRGEKMYEVAVHRDRSYPRVGPVDKPGSSKTVKKYEGSRAEEDIDTFRAIPSSGRNNLHAFGRNKVINQLSDIKVLTAKASHARNMYDVGKKIMYPESLEYVMAENGKKIVKGQKSNLFLKGSQMEVSDGSGPAWLSKQEGGLFSTDFSYKARDLNAKTKWKMGKGAVDLNANDKLFHSGSRAKTLQDKFQASSLQNGKRGSKMFSRSEDTESDSSEQGDADEDDNPLMRSKWAYPGGASELKHVSDVKNTKLSKRDKKDTYTALNKSLLSSRMMENYGENQEAMKSEHKVKRHHDVYTDILPSEDMDNMYFPGPGNIIRHDGHQQFHPSGRNGHFEGNDRDGLHMPLLKFPHPLEKRLKGESRRDFGVPKSNHMHDYNFEDDLFWARGATIDIGVPFKLGKKGQMDEPPGHHPGRSDVSLTGCNSLSKKRKIDDSTYMDMQINNEYRHTDAHMQIDDITMLRKHGKNKLEDAPDTLENGISEPHFTETEMDDVETESVPEKKPFPLITPTVLSGFSFSIIHLLSAVRMAIITLLPDDSLEVGKHLVKNDSGQVMKEEQDRKQEDIDVVNVNSSMDVTICMPSAEASVPSVSVQEIVNRVRSNPGDPCILETQEPLQDLVRGVLKIFSSRTAPLGAKGWKPLVVYEKSTKSWSWIGPVSPNLSDPETVEEVTSPDAWGLPHKMLVKLVDSFANWLKNSQETLQQIGSLPAPPLALMQINLDEKERFKDLRAQKSLSTISPSSEDVRAYFRKEEVLRYLIPDRAFSYTAVDGKKSIVAPLRRCGGKPTSKARDHFMLKRDRPPHVTILCLVRDAAARLPGSIGTRADVCTLIRDSQYIVEDVSDAQVNQVVSGALDRLHYERDPCVRFDGERKLWVYLHREREEEDFEDDGTSSTKKWRRQKKETTEPCDQGDVTVAYPGPSGQSGFDMLSDLNVEATCVDDDKRSEPDDHNGNDQVEENVETSHGSDQGMNHGPSPVIWNGLGSNSMEHNKLLCQENSANEDFDEDAFDGEPPS